jgi:hypothetical protein
MSQWKTLWPHATTAHLTANGAHIIRILSPSKELSPQFSRPDRQPLVIVGTGDYHVILCEFPDSFSSPCEALVECQFDRLSAKRLKLESRTCKGSKSYKSVSQRVDAARLSRSCLVVLSQTSFKRMSLAEVAQCKPICTQLCMNA